MLYLSYFHSLLEELVEVGAVLQSGEEIVQFNHDYRKHNQGNGSHDGGRGEVFEKVGHG
jgi:hypothetical protein